METKFEIKKRTKGEVFRPNVTVLKENNGVPTKIRCGGHEYALVQNRQFNGHKSKKENKK